MAFSPDQFGVDLLEALGFNPGVVRAFDIHCEIGHVPTIVVEQYVDHRYDLATVRRYYRLTWAPPWPPPKATP
jgi:hypothetical protein